VSELINRGGLATKLASTKETIAAILERDAPVLIERWLSLTTQVPGIRSMANACARPVSWM